MKHIGVDIGGTFTDLVLWDDAADAVSIHKLPSTPDDPARAAVAGIVEICARAGVAPADIDHVLHGTTVATNILLERSGAAVGLVTTEGFRDLVHIGRKKRPLNFSHYQDVPWQTHPIVRRRHRMTVRERVVPPDGEVVVALDEADARAAAARLAAAGVEAVAVCFLFSFLNSAHERRARDLVREALPDAYLSASHEIVPLHREYERFATTCLNAYIGPKVARYIDRFEAALAQHAFAAELHLMTSAGGVVTAAAAREKPVSLLLSGPVAGLRSGVAAGRAVGATSVITLDVGGTSADIGVAPEGELREKHMLDSRVAGYEAMIPMADVDTVGAGGGSIAYVDGGGMFRVGPRSAGAAPGPAAYGRGGEEPTVSDAFVTLGWLRPESFVHAGIAIDPALARAAIDRRIAAPLGLDVEAAAIGIVRIATQSMVEAIATNSIRKGLDPRQFTLVALGGAGPAFAVAIARELAIPRILVPPYPGVGAAAGLLSSDVAYHHQKTLWENLAAADRPRIARAFAELGRIARDRLDADGFPERAIALRGKASCRYDGQGYELTVDAPPGEVDDCWIDAVSRRFHDLHERTYLRRFDDKDVHLVSIAVTGSGRRARDFVLRAPDGGAAGEGPVDSGEVLFAGDGGFGRHAAGFYARSRLATGAAVRGPAIIEQGDATTVLPPGVVAEVGRSGSLEIELRG